MVVNGNALPLQAKIKNKKEPSSKISLFGSFIINKNLSLRLKFIDSIYRKVGQNQAATDACTGRKQLIPIFASFPKDSF
jgi:hypothetical protein